MIRGDVWWCEEPTLGRRPVCVLTRQETIGVMRAVTVAPATRTVRGIPTEVVLDEGDGMPAACALSLDNLQVVPKAVLVERVTTLSAARMREVCRALDHALACP